MELDSERDTAVPQNKHDSLPDMFPLLALPASHRKISGVFEERPSLKRHLEPFHPVKSAALVSGILTDPSLQANTIRLELLIHLLLAYGSGGRKINARQIDSCLNRELGATMFAHWEDPVEDVFLSIVSTDEGNARIFGGIWESNDFYLQGILNVVQTLPDEPSTRRLRREVHALLRLSEEIASRRGLDRFLSGGGQDKGNIRIPPWDLLKSFHRAIAFSQKDLEHLNILPADLTPFIFNMNFRTKLCDQGLGDSDLDYHPIVHYSGKWFVMLPTSISITLRRHVLEWVSRRGYQKSFDQHMVLEYQDILRETPILGPPIPKEMIIPSKQVAGRTFFEVSKQVDAGRYLQIIAIVDSIEEYLNHGFLSPNTNVSELNDQIAQTIENARSYFCKKDGFKQGLTLLVGCGYGRPSVFRLPSETPDWWVEFVSMPDLQTIAWDSVASPLILWKLVGHERFLVEHDISITNANGLLNLFAWWKETNYLMLPSEIKFGGDPINIVLPTDCLATVREKVRKGWDVHVLPHPTGKFIRVRRIVSDSYFPGEAEKPQYASIEAVIAGDLLGAWIGEKSVWWIEVESGATQLSRDLIFRVWDTVNNWLERAVPVLERVIQDKAKTNLLIILDFNEAQQEQVDPVSEDVLRSCLSVSADQETGTIRIGFRDPFFGGFRTPKNIAERTIIRALTEGVLRLAGEGPTADAIDAIVRQIVPNDDARYVHFFEAVHFRDYIKQFDRPEKLFIDDADKARSVLGLGWSVQDSGERDRFTSADGSVPFLNLVVAAISKRIRSKLHKLDRKDTIERALRHIEGVEAYKQQWGRTARSVLALRKDKASCKTVAIQQFARCDAAELALRLVIEMGVSECPLDGGEPVGELDLTPLIADALCMFHLGGSSDAINKGVMEPEVRIAPNGDVLTHVGFRDEVVDPLGQQFGAVQLDHEVLRYKDHFEPFEPIPTVKGRFPDAFIEAFEAEFGFSIDALRGVREAFENLAMQKKKCVFLARKDEILTYCDATDFTTSAIAKIALDRFTLWPRKTWDTTPEGFKQRDWYPWRFGRRLSLMARPLVQIEKVENPLYIISPGLMGVGIAYTVSRYYEAQVEISECRSGAMQRWINDEINRRGHAFARQVYEKIKAIGYEARLEVKMTDILNEKLDMDYGDVDVLAWKPGGKEALAIECKDLKFAKTPNGMAEQLNQFSGQILSSGKRDDLLKHLDRCELLKAGSIRVAQRIGLGNRDIGIQTVVCFSKPVPMQFMVKRFPGVTFHTIDDLRMGEEIGETGELST